MSDKNKWSPYLPKEERYTPDDECVGFGHYHMERMREGHIWLQLGERSFSLFIQGGSRKYKIEIKEHGK